MGKNVVAREDRAKGGQSGSPERLIIGKS